MGMHFVSHPWQVEDLDDGVIVKLSQRDLDEAETDELLELVLESGRPNLYLDLMDVRRLSGGGARKLFALDRRLRRQGGRLVLCHLCPLLGEALQVRGA